MFGSGERVNRNYCITMMYTQYRTQMQYAKLLTQYYYIMGKNYKQYRNML